MKDIREWLTCPCVQCSAERWAVAIYGAALLALVLMFVAINS